jgi:hypothetical protein
VTHQVSKQSEEKQTDEDVYKMIKVKAQRHLTNKEFAQVFSTIDETSDETENVILEQNSEDDDELQNEFNSL